MHTLRIWHVANAVVGLEGAVSSSVDPGQSHAGGSGGEVSQKFKYIASEDPRYANFVFNMMESTMFFE